jgi:UDP-N-acetylmuramate dehydrogenase
MQHFHNHPLKELNTFGITASAEELFFCSSVNDIREALRVRHTNRIMVMGGGSNLLFVGDFDGTIIIPRIEGIEVVADNGKDVLLRVGAGVVWDNLVEYCVENGYGGLENLSLIPGSVGAAPVQNIGAYGVEAGNRISSVEGVMIDDGRSFKLSSADCRFGYRDSIFKNELKGKCIITNVEFKLEKSAVPSLSYGHLRSEVEKLGDINLSNIRKAVIAIRESKLPDPAVTGNAGSFFKNPEVDQEVAASLKSQYESLTIYPLDNGRVKLPAGWLIEHAGWKGYRRGDAGVHQRQALVLVNYGNATGNEIMALACDICDSVKQKFGISLEMEVNVAGGK